MKNFNLEYKLQEFRDEQADLFDEEGKRYTGVRLSNSQAEFMLSLIDDMETEIKALGVINCPMQPKMKVTDIYGKGYGYKKVMSLHWDNKGALFGAKIDFMEDGDSSSFTTFNNYTGEFTNPFGNLKGELIFEN